MPLGLVVGLCVVGLILGFVCTLVNASPCTRQEDRAPLPVVWTLWAIFIGGIVWISIAGQQDWRVKETLHLPVLEMNGVQYVEWVKPDKQVVTINLNERFKCAFAKDNKMTLLVYESGTYFGLDYGYSWKLDLAKENQ